MNVSADTLVVRVHSISFEAEGINSFALRPAAARGTLPPFTPGAHIDVHMASGLTRSYSLVNPPERCHEYMIAVSLDPKSRGGSRYMHERVRVGDTLRVSGPRNNFPLAAGAKESLFIAGGIGITPIFCMIQALARDGRSWRLHYSARSRGVAAFLPRLRALAERSGGSLYVNFDAESGQFLDIDSIVAAAPAGVHIYACGPEAMLAAFEAASRDRPRNEIHVERFAPIAPQASAGEFTLVLARSGLQTLVRPGETILQKVLELGINAPYSCMAGVCGSCMTRVIEGTPEHRDFVLGEEERTGNEVMMICCSGAKCERLVLDL